MDQKLSPENGILGTRKLIMLILTRRVGESLMIGDDVTITVLGVKGNQVRIGVKAPKEVAVHREEILDRIAGSSNLEAGDQPHRASEEV
tara:strand:+ start:2076 stop:2342 length:267 start_codon:yes stop_codon:yes gene_type:complete